MHEKSVYIIFVYRLSEPYIVKYSMTDNYVAEMGSKVMFMVELEE